MVGIPNWRVGVVVCTRSRFALFVACLPLACGRVGYDLTDLATLGPRGVMGDGGASSGDGGAGAGMGNGGAGVGNGGAGNGGAGAGGGSGGAGGLGVDAGNRNDASNGGGGAVRDGATDGGDGAADVGPPVEAGFPTCSVTRRWTQAFDSDPTQSDNDNDGTNDWVVRGGAPFPVSELSGGVWHASESPLALDSRPLDDFGARTIVDVRFRSLTVPASHRGAVFWINLNQSGPAMSALFASLVGVTGGSQELTLYGKTGTIEVPIAVFPSLPDGFVELHLDIDPVGKSVAAWIGGVPQGNYTIPETSAPNADAFATVISWEGQSEFDEVKISICSP
jgi:hypothetical protein